MDQVCLLRPDTRTIEGGIGADMVPKARSLPGGSNTNEYEVAAPQTRRMPLQSSPDSLSTWTRLDPSSSSPMSATSWTGAPSEYRSRPVFATHPPGTIAIGPTSTIAPGMICSSPLSFGHRSAQICPITAALRIILLPRTLVARQTILSTLRTRELRHASTTSMPKGCYARTIRPRLWSKCARRPRSASGTCRPRNPVPGHGHVHPLGELRSGDRSSIPA